MKGGVEETGVSELGESKSVAVGEGRLGGEDMREKYGIDREEARMVHYLIEEKIKGLDRNIVDKDLTSLSERLKLFVKMTCSQCEGKKEGFPVGPPAFQPGVAWHCPKCDKRDIEALKEMDTRE